jgi:type IV pilus assembly protein PilA
MSRHDCKSLASSGFSLIELLIVIVILVILASISIAFLGASRRAANGTSAVQALRIISESEASYASGVGNRDYADPQELFEEEFIDQSLASACIPRPTSPSKSGIPALPASSKSGFIFIFENVPASENIAPSYKVIARPVVDTGIARTGDRTYYVDQTGVIRTSSNPNEIPTESSRPIE